MPFVLQRNPPVVGDQSEINILYEEVVEPVKMTFAERSKRYVLDALEITTFVEKQEFRHRLSQKGRKQTRLDSTNSFSLGI